MRILIGSQAEVLYILWHRMVCWHVNLFTLPSMGFSAEKYQPTLAKRTQRVAFLDAHEGNGRRVASVKPRRPGFTGIFRLLTFFFVANQKYKKISSTVLIASYFRKPNGKLNWFLRKIIFALLETENSALQQAGHHTAVITCSSARQWKQFSTNLSRVPGLELRKKAKRAFGWVRESSLYGADCSGLNSFLPYNIIYDLIFPDTSCSW